MKATCTWGDGPDVLLELDEEEYGLMCYEEPKHREKAEHGYVSKGSIDLTYTDARNLARQLLLAAGIAEGYEKGWIEAGRGASKGSGRVE